MMGKEEAGKQRRDRKENGRGRKWWSMVDLMIFPVLYCYIRNDGVGKQFVMRIYSV